MSGYFNWGQKAPKPTYTSDIERRTVNPEAPVRNYYIPASQLSPEHTTHYMSQAADMSTAEKLGKSFWNGLVIDPGRGVLGTLQMLRDLNWKYYPERRETGQDLLSAPLNSSWLQPYQVETSGAAEEFGVNVARAVGQIAGQTAVTLATGGTGGMAFMGTQIAGNQYLDLNHKGVDPEVAAKAAATNAAIQMPLERLAIGKILSKVPAGSGMGQKVKQVAEAFLTEGGTEAIQEYPDEITSIYALNATKSASEIADIVKSDIGDITRNALYSGLIGGVTGAGASAVNVAVRSALNRTAAQQEQQILEAQLAAAKNAGAAPEMVQAYTDYQHDGETLSIDADAIVSYAQSAHKDLGTIEQSLGLQKGELNRAASEGDVIETTRGRILATAMKDGGFMPAVSEHIAYFDGNGFTLSREQIQKEAAKLYEQDATNEVAMDTWQTNIQQQLKDAGATKQEALDLVTILSHIARTQSPDNPAAFFEKYPITFQRGETGKLAVNGLNQLAWHGSAKTFDHFDLGKVGSGEGGSAHGWGIYAAKNRSVSDAYKTYVGAGNESVVLNGKTYTVPENGKADWTDGTAQYKYGDAMTYVLDELWDGNSKETAIADLQQAIKTKKIRGKYVAEAQKAIEILKTAQAQIANRPTLYKVDIPKTSTLLDENKRYREQMKGIQSKIIKAVKDLTPEQKYIFWRLWLRNANADVENAKSVANSQRLNTIANAIANPEDALNKGIGTGKEIYDYLTQAMSYGRNIEQTSKYLLAHGINGITYDGLQDGRCYVVFDDKAVNIIERYNQATNADSIRGQIAFDQEGRAIVSLFENSDPSTVIHEAVGHYMANVLAREAAVDNPNPQLAKDFATMLDYADTTREEWDKLTSKPPAERTAEETARLTQIQETWATAAEQYMMEGKAPTKDLRTAFRHFKKWLLGIYRNIEAFLAGNEYAVPITDDVRQVFNRMLVSDLELENLRRTEGYLAKLPKPLLDKLSDSTREKLQDYVDKAYDKAVEMLSKSALADFGPERRKAMDEYRKKVHEEAVKEVEGQKLYIAEARLGRYIGQNRKTMNGVTALTPSAGNSISVQYFAQWYEDMRVLLNDPKARKLTDREQQIMTEFDAMAEQNSYTCGDEMAKAILENPDKAHAVKAAVERRVKAKFGDYDQAYEKALKNAREAFYTDEGGTVAAVEYQLLEEQAYQELAKQRNAETRKKLAVAMQQNLKLAAEKSFRKLTVRDAMKTSRYIVAERKAAEKATVAMAQGNYEEAMAYKRQQLYQHYCVRESIKAKARVERVQKYLRRQHKAKRNTWHTEEHFNQAADLFARMGMPRKDYNPLTKTQSLAEYAAAMDEKFGNVAIADWLLKYQGDLTNPFRTLTVEQYEDVGNALKNIKAIANEENGWDVFASGLTRQEYQKKALDTLSRLKDKWHPEPGHRQTPGRLESFKASLQNTDNLLEGMGKFFLDTIGISIKHANDKEAELTMEMQDRLGKAYKEWAPTEQIQAAYDTTVYYEQLKASVDRNTLVKLLVNLGNEGNARVLCTTPPLGLEQSPLWVMPNEQLSVDEAAAQTRQNLIDFLAGQLDEHDVRYAQAMIDVANSHWDEMAALEKRKTGFTPKKVEAGPVLMRSPDGSRVMLFRGGYFPLVRDSDAGSRPMALDVVPDIDTGMQQTSRTMHTSRGHMQERVKASYPIDLKKGAEYRPLTQAIHDLAWRDTVDNLRQLLNDPVMYSALKTKLGLADMKALVELATRCADPSARAGGVGEELLGKCSGWLRQKTVFATVMCNLGIVTQNIGNLLLYGNAIDGWTNADVLRAMGNYYLNMDAPEGYKSARDFMYAKSVFMRERSVMPDITLRDMQEDTPPSKREKAIEKFGTACMVWTDNLTALPQWVGVYQKMVNSGHTEQEAVDAADMLIRRTLGSSRVTDVAPIMRTTGVAKLLTVFQGFFNAQYNQWAREAKIFLDEKDVGRLLTFVIGKWLAACFANLILLGENPLEKDEDGYRNITKEVLKYPMSMLGPAGQIGNTILENALGMRSFGYKMSPVITTVEKTAGAAHKAYQFFAGKATGAEAAEAAMNVASIFAGIPTQVNKLFWNGYDILFNDMTPRVTDLTQRRPRKERNQ